MKKILFIRRDIRECVKDNTGHYNFEKEKKLYQVHSLTRKKYKVGDYLSCELKIQPYCSTRNGKILYLTEKVLVKVVEIRQNIIFVDIVKE